jgi:hypothetical protein
MVGHSRLKDGVASLAYVPAIHVLIFRAKASVGWAKAIFAVPTFFLKRFGGHAALCPPYGFV